MKFLTNPIFRTVLIIAVWFLCLRKIYLEFSHTSFLDLVLPLLFFAAGVISLLSFLVDYSRYKRCKRTAFYIPTVVTVLCIATVIGTNQYLKQQDNTPTVLYASKFYSGLNTISIDFRENGTYKCSKDVFFSDEYYTRGKYSIKDSVIYLDKSDLFDIVRSDKLKMMTIPKSEKSKKGNLLPLLFGSSKPDTLSDTYLFQLDNKGDTIPSAVVFRVNGNLLGSRN